MEKDLTNNVKQDEKMATESATDSTTDTQVDKPNFVPQARVNEMTANFKSEIDDLKSQIDKRNKADKENELAELEKRGEQDKVIAQLKQELEIATPYMDKYNNLVTAQKAELLKDLPKELQDKYVDHELEVVADIHNAYKANASKSNMVNSKTAVRNVNMNANEVVKSKELSWGEKLNYFKTKNS